MMSFSVKQIAALTGASVEGDAETQVHSLCKIDDGQPGGLCFLANPKYEPFIYETEASAVLVAESFVPRYPVRAVLLRVKDPYASFALLMEQAAQMGKKQSTGIDARAFVAESAAIAEDVYVGPFACIMPGAKIGAGARIHAFSYVGESVVVGEASVLYPHVTVYQGCRIGARCIVHAGAVIGADGFGFAPQADGSYKKIPQLGVVVLEDEVEIGANTCIDRAAMGETLLQKGVKLDNLVQVAHNVAIGAHTVMAAQAGVAGSARIGAGCMIGGQAGLVGHIRLADGVKIDAQSGVNRSLEKSGAAYRGSPVQPHRDQLRTEVLLRQLAEMEKRIRELEKRVPDDAQEV